MIGRVTGAEVALLHCATYESKAVDRAVRAVFATVGYAPPAGTRVLVKPNLLKADAGGLCCTHPEVVRAACAYLLDRGCRVTVGDSPAFGSAQSVAQSIGLASVLAPLQVPIITLGNPVSVRLPYGMSIGISRYALETDALLSIPRVKAHCQMRITCAVKNMFGCVAGVRKALAHSVHGDKQNAFRALLVEVAQVLPATVALVDGVVAMDRTGPSGGDAYPLGMVGASLNTVALDTAVYTLLGATPQDIPLWGELQRRGMAGAFAEDIAYVLHSPAEFAAATFRIPHLLTPETFHPARLMKSALIRYWLRLRG